MLRQPLAADKGTSSKSLQLPTGHWRGRLPSPSLQGPCPPPLDFASDRVPNTSLHRQVLWETRQVVLILFLTQPFSFPVSTKTLESKTRALPLVPASHPQGPGVGRGGQEQPFPRALPRQLGCQTWAPAALLDAHAERPRRAKPQHRIRWLPKPAPDPRQTPPDTALCLLSFECWIQLPGAFAC